MLSGDVFLSTLREIGTLAARLPKGAEVRIEWMDAPPDLVLAVSLPRGAHLRTVRLADGGERQWAEWKRGPLLVRAHAGGRPLIRMHASGGWDG